MASERFVSRARALGPVDQVWTELQQPATWRQIGGVSGISDERFDEHGDLVGYRFTIVVGGSSYRGSAVRMAVERYRRMVMGIDTSHLTGEIAVDLEPEDVATWVGLSLSMTSKGLLSAMMFPVIVRSVASGFERATTDFVSSLSS